jgi:hypothetical protein
MSKRTDKLKFLPIDEYVERLFSEPAKKRGRPPTGVKEPWKELNISKATYYRRIRLL